MDIFKACFFKNFFLFNGAYYGGQGKETPLYFVPFFFVLVDKTEEKVFVFVFFFISIFYHIS